MTLRALLARTGDPSRVLPTGAVQVFPRSNSGAPYFRLDDFRVSSAVSGPSLVLVPTNNHRNGGV